MKYASYLQRSRILRLSPYTLKVKIDCHATSGANLDSEANTPFSIDWANPWQKDPPLPLPEPSFYDVQRTGNEQDGSGQFVAPLLLRMVSSDRIWTDAQTSTTLLSTTGHRIYFCISARLYTSSFLGLAWLVTLIMIWASIRITPVAREGVIVE
ncbi:hypothetical protein HNY73_012905 [Argiope bruennichi]|uniref:Uncharacterized protein n=1 Tax=Argiope bruennichi TaxID=94029 RepID=A0A8T0EY23_ARGBR|nr:hypothetical protein HNY73_012905 [Argiope bruennichi]